MHWPFLTAMAVAGICYQLGATTAWVTVLSVALKAALMAVACALVVLAAAALRRRLGRCSNST